MAVILCTCYKSSCQESYYFKELSFVDQTPIGGFHLEVDSLHFYVSSSSLCVNSEGDSVVCMVLSKHFEDASTDWIAYLPWCRSANKRAIKIRGDTIFVSGDGTGHQDDKIITTDFYSIDGQHLKHFEFNYESIISNDRPLLFVNGNLFVKNELYIYGGLRSSHDEGLGWIQRLPLNGSKEKELLLFYENTIGNNSSPMRDLMLDSDTSLVFISDISSPNGNRGQKKRITRIDLEGNQINEFLAPDTELSTNVLPNLVVTKEQNFIFTHSVDSIFENFINVHRVLSYDQFGNQLWTYNYPYDREGTLTITEMETAKNGDVIACGFIENLGLTDGYLMRMNSDGHMLWERKYTKFKHDGSQVIMGLRDIREYYDGSLISIGTNAEGKMIILKTNSEGCLDMDYCGFENRLTSTADFESKLDINIYPNPVDRIINIEFQEFFCDKLIISNFLGETIQVVNLKTSSESLDFSEYSNGIYFLSFYKNDYFYDFRKVMISK